MGKTEKMQSLVDFANEPFDIGIAYELFCRGCTVSFEGNTSDFEDVDIDGQEVDLRAIAVLIVEDGSIHLSLQAAWATINHILRKGCDVSDLKLSDVSSVVVIVDSEPVVGFILGGDPFTEGDLVFAFFENIKGADVGCCAKEGCGRLFFGTRNKTKKFCSSSCRVAFCQKEKRRKNRSGRKK